jgi:spore germination protein Q
MTYSPSNNQTNGYNYYNFPAYRAVVGNQPQGMSSPITQDNMQGYPQQVIFPQTPITPIPPGFPRGTPMQGVPSTPPAPVTPGLAPIEQSYIENILRFNLGKVGTFYMTYENNTQWNAKIFKGKIEAAGRDHIIISDAKTGIRYLLLMVNLDYATFDEELNYSSPYQQVTR